MTRTTVASLPRETAALFGHAEAEQALAASLPERAHAACLADRRPARHRQGDAGLSASPVSCWRIPIRPRRRCRRRPRSRSTPTHPVARRVAAQAQGDLLVIERVVNEQTGKLYTVIRVDDVRRTVSFFGSTAGEGGWRIAIVDSVDELQREGANALLKVLEEPPPRALLLLVSHAPGRELPTIRSRCRRLLLRPLAADDVARAVGGGDRPRCGRCRNPGGGARRGGQRRPRALRSSSGRAGAAPARARPFRAIARPRSARAARARRCARWQRSATLAAFMDLVNDWLSARLAGGAGPKAQLARVAETWEKVNRAAARGRDL